MAVNVSASPRTTRSNGSPGRWWQLLRGFTCRGAGWRPLPSGRRRSVITIRFFHDSWRFTSTEAPLHNSAAKWRLAVSAWRYINQPRPGDANVLSRSGGFCDLIGCSHTSVKLSADKPPPWSVHVVLRHFWQQWMYLVYSFGLKVFIITSLPL